MPFRAGVFGTMIGNGLGPAQFAPDGTGLAGLPLIGPSIDPFTAALLGVMVAAALTALISLPALVAAFEESSWRSRAGIVLACLAGLAARKALGTGGFFHENFYENVLMSRIHDVLSMRAPAGQAYGLLVRWLVWPRAPFPGQVFEAMTLLGVATIPLAGLVSWLAFRDEVAAVATALLLAFNPIHARLSISEDAGVPMLFLLLSASASLLLAARPPPWLKAPRWDWLPAVLVLHAAAALSLMVHLRTEYAAFLPVPLLLLLGVRGAARRLGLIPATYVAALIVSGALLMLLPDLTRPGSPFRWVTGAQPWISALTETGDFRAPDRIALLSPDITPPLLLVLAAIGFARMVMRRQGLLAAALVACLALCVFLFLGNTGFPSNARVQFPYHILCLLAAGFGAGGLAGLAGSSRSGGALLAAGGVAMVVASYALAIGPLAVRGSPTLESEWVRQTLPRLPVGRHTLLVRLEPHLDATHVNGSFPDYLLRYFPNPPRALAISSFLARHPTEAEMADTVYYGGLSCALAKDQPLDRLDDSPNRCRELEEEFRLIPIAATEVPNIPYDTIVNYPDPRRRPGLPHRFLSPGTAGRHAPA